jgi:hypothetical protein
MTSGRPASYSSKQRAMLFCSAHGRIPSLNSVLQDDGVLADEVDARDVAVEVDAHARPVEAGGDLLDVGRLAGAVIAGDHHAAVAREAGENGERRLAVEDVVRVEVGDVLLGLRVGGHLEVRVDAEDLAYRHLHVRHGGGCLVGGAHESLFDRTFSEPSRQGRRAAVFLIGAAGTAQFSRARGGHATLAPMALTRARPRRDEGAPAR